MQWAFKDIFQHSWNAELSPTPPVARWHTLLFSNAHQSRKILDMQQAQVAYEQIVARKADRSSD